MVILCTHKTNTNSIEIDLCELNLDGIAQRDWVGIPTPLLLRPQIDNIILIRY